MIYMAWCALMHSVPCALYAWHGVHSYMVCPLHGMVCIIASVDNASVDSCVLGQTVVV